MKTIIIIAIALLLNVLIFPSGEIIAQVPEKINYQAIVTNHKGYCARNAKVNIQISILQYSKNGNAVYIEDHTTYTKSNGMINLEIGTGNTILGDFSAIEWNSGPYFIKSETRFNRYYYRNITTISELLSVPFALHAKTADSISGGFIEQDGDATNELEMPLDAKAGDMTYYNGSNWVKIPKPQNNRFNNYGLSWDFDNNKPFWDIIGNNPFPYIKFLKYKLFTITKPINSEVTWGINIHDSSYKYIGADAQLNGKDNTMKIIDHYGQGSYPAYICDTLTAHGFDDWYLPARCELLELYYQFGGLEWPEGIYWSSTEIDENHASALNIPYHPAKFDKHTTSIQTRCVRRETINQ